MRLATFSLGLLLLALWQTPSQWNTLSSSSPSPDSAPLSPGTLDDEFNEPSLDMTRWTWVNQGTTTTSISKGVLGMSVPSSTTDQLSFIVQPAPAPPWTVACKINYAEVVMSNYSAGIFLRDSVSGKIENWGIEINTNFAVFPVMTVNNWNSFNNGFASNLTVNNTNPTGWHYLAVQDDGVNLNFLFSWDGIFYIKMLSQPRKAFLTNGPNQVGVGGDANNNEGGTGGGTTPQLVNVDWFRRTQ